MTVRIFTDGSCSSNPGPGGWAAVFELDGECRAIVGNDVKTTNNRMELRAVIEAVRRVMSRKVKALRHVEDYQIHSDSAYVVNAINKGWLAGWRSRGWRNDRGEKTKNKDMWEELVTLLDMAKAAGVNVEFIKVKGHAGEPLNEMADRLAVGQTEEAKRRLSE